MTEMRRGRRKYYDAFSKYYDRFVEFHAGKERNATREILVRAAGIDSKSTPRILDICCGTGAVILAFARRRPEALLIGYDFSHGMLLKAIEKQFGKEVYFVEGDAVRLPFPTNTFDVVSCSHALYELKKKFRLQALREMRRVVRPDGVVLLMEHEKPQQPIMKIFFYLRLLSMGSDDAREFVQGNLDPYKQIFSDVRIAYSHSGRSKLLVCRKCAK